MMTAAAQPNAQPYAQHLRALFACAVAAANPGKLLPVQLPHPPKGRLLIVSTGKAAAEMVHSACLHYRHQAPVHISGVLSGARGALMANNEFAALIGDWQVFHGGHPLPNAQSLAAGAAALALVADMQADDLLLVLLSGGGSAMLEALNPGLELADLLALNQALLRSGLDIAKVNLTRVRFSAIKAGRLLACVQARGAASVTLLMSDVPDGAPHLIASGPSLPWPARAARIAHSDELRLPPGLDPLTTARLRAHASSIPDLTMGPLHRIKVLANPTQSLQAAAKFALTKHSAVLNLGADLGGEAQELGRKHAEIALEYAHRKEAVLLLSGGETSVTLNKQQTSARGGRNSEYLLAVLEVLAAAACNADFYGLAADSDGIDGSGPEAGAQFGPDTIRTACSNLAGVRYALSEHDALGWFAKFGEALHTGPTGTNVNDFRALWVVPD